MKGKRIAVEYDHKEISISTSEFIH